MTAFKLIPCPLAQTHQSLENNSQLRQLAKSNGPSRFVASPFIYCGHMYSFFKQEGAYADVVVKLGLVKLLTKRFDVCEEAYVMFVSTFRLLS